MVRFANTIYPYSLAYEVGDWRFPSTGINGQPGNQVSLRLCLGKTEVPAPLIVVLPIWGTFEYPTEKLAWKLRQHFAGHAHIAVLGGQNRLVQWQGIADADSREALLLQAQLSATHVEVTAEDIRALFRWARAQSFVDPDRLLLAGFSIGAIAGSVAAIRDEPSLLGTILVLGAGCRQPCAGHGLLQSYCRPKQGVRDAASGHGSGTVSGGDARSV